MSDIYRKFDRAFANVDAYCVLKDGKPVARVCLKYPKDGAGRLTAFVQVYGFEMKRGWASGYGYDKATAAVSSCAPLFAHLEGVDETAARVAADFAALKDAGHRWDAQLRLMGYEVQSLFG